MWIWICFPRSFGYGHSFGVLSHYYGREAGLELREDIDTVVRPGMVISMEPMLTIPEGMPGAGGYRWHHTNIRNEDIWLSGSTISSWSTGTAALRTSPSFPSDRSIISYNNLLNENKILYQISVHPQENEIFQLLIWVELQTLGIDIKIKLF